MADNVDVIQGLWDAFGKGDLDKAVAGIADDAEVVFPESLPWGGSHRGPEGFRDALATLVASFDSFSAKPEKILGADDDHVTVITRATGKTKNGKAFEGRVAWIYQLRDGKVIRAEAFPDTAQVLEALA
jgi:ketosteroid isomerase-like protein